MDTGPVTFLSRRHAFNCFGTAGHHSRMVFSKQTISMPCMEKKKTGYYRKHVQEVDCDLTDFVLGHDWFLKVPHSNCREVSCPERSGLDLVIRMCLDFTHSPDL